jgi:hypothetical protein
MPYDLCRKINFVFSAAIFDMVDCIGWFNFVEECNLCPYFFFLDEAWKWDAFLDALQAKKDNWSWIRINKKKN